MVTTISVKQARQKLGDKGKKMTDKEIQKLIDLLYFVANRAIDFAINK